MSVEKITSIGGMTRLKKDGIGFTVSITQVERKIKSLDAKGLYIHLVGYPENWTFYRNKLIEELGIGKDKMKRCMDELKDLGLIIETEIRDENGRFVENQLHVSLGLVLAPQFCEENQGCLPQADLPHTGKPYTGDPVYGKQPTININNTNKHNYTHSETESDQKTNSFTETDVWDGYAEFEQVYPAHRLGADLNRQEAWIKAQGWQEKDKILADVKERKENDGDWVDNCICSAVKYLNEKRWNKPMAPLKQQKKQTNQQKPKVEPPNPTHGIKKNEIELCKWLDPDLPVDQQLRKQCPNRSCTTIQATNLSTDKQHDIPVCKKHADELKAYDKINYLNYEYKINR